MAMKDENLLKRLLATFKVEAQEHIQTIASAFVELENAATQEARSGLLDATLRAAHSLKGAARAVDASDIEALCQPLESVLAALKRGHLVGSAELFDLLHRATHALANSLQALSAGTKAARDPALTDLIHSLHVAATARVPPPQSAPAQSAPAPAPTPTPAVPSMTEAAASAAASTVRVAASTLDAVLLQAEELLPVKLAAAQHAAKLRELYGAHAEWKKRWARLRPNVRAIRQAIETAAEDKTRTPPLSHFEDVSEFLEWNQQFVGALGTQLLTLAAAADVSERSTAVLVDDLLDEMKKLVMQPFSTVLDLFPRLVRELAREQRKDVELVMRGQEMEIDRRILEQMKDPLIHLIRNCLDHGIEAPAARLLKGKPARGTIKIAVSAKSGGSLELLVGDDGAGIALREVKAAARRLRVLPADAAEALADSDAVPLVFHSGLSTAPIITDLSGRGLGLAIVKEKVEKLNGTISVETSPGDGTIFRIVLPATLARFRGVLVRAGEYRFALPAGNVERALRFKRTDIKTVENRETLELRGETLSVVRLSTVLELAHKNAADSPPTLSAVILSCTDQRMVFLVDEVLGEQEILVKALGKQLARLPHVAGATILSTGQVVPVLNVQELMKSAVRVSGAGATSAAASPVASSAGTSGSQRSVLVAEDSITSRDLLKNILEAAGYRVTTAVDGIDAFTQLRSGTFDLVVSDVDMPRLNGLDLTARIRADRHLSELPVVLVTSLDSRTDRERGIEVGADAYIIKSSFDQTNLLQVLQQLL
jgi:two-component system chemotaxis sensor kinase CheA